MSAIGVDEQGSAGSATSRAAPDTALESFILMLAYLGLPADAAQLRHSLGKGSVDLGIDDLLVLSKRLDIRARHVRASAPQLDALPLPAVARLTDGSFLLLLQVSDTEALIFRPGDGRPSKVSRPNFAEEFSGDLVLMTTRDRIAGSARAF